jgi:hypothetical protein
MLVTETIPIVTPKLVLPQIPRLLSDAESCGFGLYRGKVSTRNARSRYLKQTDYLNTYRAPVAWDRVLVVTCAVALFGGCGVFRRGPSTLV